MVSKPSSSSGCLVPFSAKLFPNFTIVPGDPRLPPAREGREGVTASSPAPSLASGEEGSRGRGGHGPGLGRGVSQALPRAGPERRAQGRTAAGEGARPVPAPGTRAEPPVLPSTTTGAPGGRGPRPGAAGSGPRAALTHAGSQVWLGARSEPPRRPLPRAAMAEAAPRGAGRGSRAIGLATAPSSRSPPPFPPPPGPPVRR